MQLYKSEPKHEKPLDFFRNALGDSVEKNTQFDVMVNKMKVLEEQNDLLKSQNAELAKLQVILERFSCESMTIDDDHKENESKIAQDIDMCAANDDTNVAHASIKEEKLEKMDSENCDFSNAQNSTLKESLDDDMSEFEDSLFNAKVVNQKLVSSCAQMVLESADENVAGQPVLAVATTEVSATSDATKIESERTSIPDEQNTSDTPKLLTIEIDSNSEEPGTTAVDAADLHEQVATESVSVSIIDQQSSPENASETFTFENDSEMPCETKGLVTTVAEQPVNFAYELQTIIEETASTLAPVVEENPNEETVSDVYRLPTISPQILECVSQTTPISPGPMPQLAAMDNCESDASKRNQLDLDTNVSSDLATIDWECTSIPNSQSSSVDSQNTVIVSQTLDEIAEPIEMESEPSPTPSVQQHSSTLSAPENATIENDSVISCEVAAVNSTSSDTLSADTDTASIPTSQQSSGSPESIITEIRTHIVDAVLNKFDECDQTDSAIPFVDESQANTSNRNTLDDIEHYIRHDQGKQDKMAQSGYPADELKIEVDAPQPAMNTCEPISAQFNPSQIVSLDYTASGNEILTLDVPVSHGTSSSMIFDLDTSLPLSQFSSDVGEESDYLLPPRQSDVSFKHDGNISFGSQSVLDTTADYAADGELNSSSSSDTTINRSDDNLEMESNQSTLSQPANENSIDSVPEKNGKRKLSIADDVETEFLLSKSRKPGVQSTPFSTN